MENSHTAHTLFRDWYGFILGDDMADLLELRSAIEAVWLEKKNANVCFFGRSDGRFRSGNILVSSNGLGSVSYGQLGLVSALQEMCAIQYEKILVIALPDSENTVDENGPHTISIQELMGKLVPYVPPAVIEPPQLESFQVVDSTEATEHQSVMETPVADASLSVENAIELMNSCKRLLEKYYGSGAEKKVHEISLVCSPKYKPKDFLDECMALLVVMTGVEKATKMFKPLYEKIS
jgi:hypothetical protein